MKKPNVVDVYNGGKNGVDVNDQHWSHYPPGKLLTNGGSICTGFFDGEYLHPGETIKRKEEATKKKKRHQLDFLQE